MFAARLHKFVWTGIAGSNRPFGQVVQHACVPLFSCLAASSDAQLQSLWSTVNLGGWHLQHASAPQVWLSLTTKFSLGLQLLCLIHKMTSLKAFLMPLDASRDEAFVDRVVADLALVDITQVCHLSCITYDDLKPANMSTGIMGHLRLALAKLKPTVPAVQAWGTGACSCLQCILASSC